MRAGTAEYIRQHSGRGACPQVQSTLAKLSLCRTAALGGKTYQCDVCGAVTKTHHSCGDRHCPICSGRKRYDFAARASQRIHPRVTYDQVVFTLPDGSRNSPWPTACPWRNSCSNRPGKRSSHWHVHALVPGGGPSLSEPRWKQAEAPPQAPYRHEHYLVGTIDLHASFRRFAIAHLRRLRDRGQLKLRDRFAYVQDDDAWESFCEQLKSIDWVSSIHPPPTTSSSAHRVVRYLTRYLTGGPISDARIVSADRREVTFLARPGDRPGGDRQQIEVTLPRTEFIRRWCLHIQPDQLTKVRYFGGWSNTRQAAYMARGRELLQLRANKAPEPPSEEAFTRLAEAVDHEEHRCPDCQLPALRLIAERAKPSWSRVLHHLHRDCPAWYAELGKAAKARYLWEEYGITHDDWYLALGIESASERPRSVEQIQLYLPGLSPTRDFALESHRPDVTLSVSFRAETTTEAATKFNARSIRPMGTCLPSPIEDHVYPLPG